MKFSKTPINPQGRQFIQCTEDSWEDGLRVSVRTAFVEVEPAAADRKIKEMQDGKLIVSFGSLNKQTGLYAAEVVKAEVGELEHA